MAMRAQDRSSKAVMVAIQDETNRSNEQLKLEAAEKGYWSQYEQAEERALRWEISKVNKRRSWHSKCYRTVQVFESKAKNESNRGSCELKFKTATIKKREQ